uniref:Uncharacterized protein n=1 Tax=Arundo donax TaxID=35708 RepID=A0A0A9ASB0_ARUDO
MDYAFSLVLGV